MENSSYELEYALWYIEDPTCGLTMLQKKKRLQTLLPVLVQGDALGLIE